MQPAHPIPREKFIKALEEVAKETRLDDRKVRRAKTEPGGSLRYSKLGREVSREEYRAIVKEMGLRDWQQRRLYRKLRTQEKPKPSAAPQPPRSRPAPPSQERPQSRQTRPQEGNKPIGWGEAFREALFGRKKK